MRGLWNNLEVSKLIILFIMAVVLMSGLVTNGKIVSACDFGSNLIEPHTDSNVFVGKALEIRGDKNGKDVLFEVYKVEQGTVKALTGVWTPPAGSSCGGFDFKVGEMYYVITIDTPIFPSKKVVMINTARPLLAEEKSEKEQIEGQSLLENFLKRTDVSVSINGEDLVMNRPYNYFYSNKDNRVMVPLNEAFMSRFGIEVTQLNEEDDSVTLNVMGKVYTYQIGLNTLRFGENDLYLMDTVIQRFEGITFIPARQVADMIGAQLTWDNKLKKIDFSF